MLSEPRAILFQTELEWLPPDISDFRIGKEAIRLLYNKLFEPEFSDYRYENLDLQSQKPTLSKQTNGQSSLCQFGEHSIIVEERRPTFYVDHFVTIVTHVLSALKEVFDDIQEHNFPQFLVQRCRIQCLAQPNHSEDSLDLLAGKVAQVKDEIGPFERPPSFFGVRFRFAPVLIVDDNGEEETSRHEDFVTVRFETFSDDPSQVWMEVAAHFLLTHGKAGLDALDVVQENIQNTYGFLANKCKRFLDQFDECPPSTDSEAGAEPPADE